eukprot:280779-Karenia_brevis.AAC.1
MVESEVNPQGVWDVLNYEAPGSMSMMLHCIEELRDPNKCVLLSVQDSLLARLNDMIFVDWVAKTNEQLIIAGTLEHNSILARH